MSIRGWAACIAALALGVTAGCAEDSKDTGTDTVDDTSDVGTADTGAGDTADEDTSSDTNTEPDTGDPTGGEICDNGIDDNENAFIDCADKGCKGHPACSESDCGNGTDDDGDGLADCDDPDCEDLLACKEFNCNLYYNCLLETACACTVGSDCPGGDEAQDCIDTCAGSETCSGNCVEGMPDELQAPLIALEACMAESCDGLTGTTRSQCRADNCMPEFSECYYFGDLDCGEFYFVCTPECAGNQSCFDACVDNLSPAGFVDAVAWDECRFGTCDGNNDNTADSNECVNLAGYFTCGSESGECFGESSGLGAGAGTCNETMDCVLACDALANGACIEACAKAASSDGMAGMEPVVDCILSECGTTAAGLSKDCVSGALNTACAEQWVTCGGEVVTPSKKYVRLLGALTECTEDVDTGAPGADIDAVSLDLLGDAAPLAVTVTSFADGEVCETNDNADSAAVGSEADAAFVSLNGGTLVLELTDGGDFPHGAALMIFEDDADAAEEYTVELADTPEGDGAVSLGTFTGTQASLPIDLL